MLLIATAILAEIWLCHTFIDITLTVTASEPGDTTTSVAIDFIRTGRTIPTGLRLTIINVCQAVCSCESAKPNIDTNMMDSLEQLNLLLGSDANQVCKYKASPKVDI